MGMRFMFSALFIGNRWLPTHPSTCVLSAYAGLGKRERQANPVDEDECRHGIALHCIGTVSGTFAAFLVDADKTTQVRTFIIWHTLQAVTPHPVVVRLVCV